VGKKQPKMDLAELEVILRDAFQKYRRRLDMLTAARGTTMSDEELGQFIDAMQKDDEDLARKILKIAKIRSR
jgi:succinate dehydrogenase flavin-adding protein (antitoxin of CptAB toxin-antitoxin module)